MESEDKVKKHLTKIEERLKISPWLVGSQFSLADINVFPFVRQLFRIQPTPVFLDSFPNLCEWQTKISQRPSVIESLKK
ncbi:hypothetical protein EBS43_12855 [bacterium]|nr:hypothetical protein [bacterium]